MTYEKFKGWFGWIICGLQWFFATLPVAGLLLIYTYYIRARSFLGYWPTPYKPDPKTETLLEAMGSHYFLAGTLFYLLLPSVLLFLLFIPLCKFFCRDYLVKKRWVVLLISWGLFMFLLSNDPGKIMEWYFD